MIGWNGIGDPDIHVANVHTDAGVDADKVA